MILDCLQSKKYGGNYGRSPIVHTIKKVSHRQTRRSIESAIEKWIKNVSQEMSIV